jgi:hypothetical protein
MKTTMKISALYNYLAAGLLLFQFETALSADSGALFTASTITSRAVYEKVFTDLKSSKLTQNDLQRLGPGVTGGGDSCEQKIAYSYSFLLEMIEKDKISATIFKADKATLLNQLKQTKFGFDRGLKKDRPVEMLNAPVLNAILLDRSICDNNFEPLSYYAPILMHETLRLAGRQEDDTDYAISKSYVGLLRQEANKELNSNRRSFRVMSGTANGTIALAWGLRGEPLDFESFDNLPYEDQMEFVQNNLLRLENYIVDLKRNRILMVVRSVPENAGEDDFNEADAGYAEFGDEHVRYHAVDSEYHFDPKNNVGFMVTSIGKIDKNMETIFAVNEKQEIVGSCAWECAKIIEKAAQKKLTPAQKKDVEELGFYDYKLIQSGDNNYWEVTLSMGDSRSDNYPTYRAKMTLKFENGKFQPRFGNFKKIGSGK